MQTLKISVTVGDEVKPGMELHMSSPESDCDVAVELPVRHPGKKQNTSSNDKSERSEEDAYVLGGYSGI